MDLVTGASGFLGGHLVSSLVERGRNVRVLLRSTSDVSHLKHPAIERKVGDLLDKESIRAAVSGADRVYHCAGLVADWGPRREFVSANVQGLRVLLEQSVAGGVRRFVHVSSSDVYGFPDYPAGETARMKRRGFPYGDSKVAGEELVWEFSNRLGLPVTVVRPASIYGPGSATLVREITDLLLAGQMLYVGSGETNAGLAYASNVTDLMILAADNEAAIGEAYNATDGSSVTWREYVERLAELVGATPPRKRIPYGAAYAAGYCLELVQALRGWPTRPLVTRMTAALFGTNQGFPIDKAERELGYVPRVDIDEGMRRTGVWLAEVYTQKMRPPEGPPIISK